MICTSIQNKTYDEIVSLISGGGIEMAEVRLDLCPALTEAQVQDLFGNFETPLIATCRGDASRLATAIKAGARFADLEIEAPASESRMIQKLCKEYGTELIRSYHNFSCTPSDEELQRTLARCFRYGAEIVKIAVTARGEEDMSRILSLYSVVLEGVDSMEGRLVAFAMDPADGSFSASSSRVECLRRGAPFSYACPDEGKATAAGQMNVSRMSEAVYGKLSPVSIKGQAAASDGEALCLPCAKSIAQRAIVAAALAEGVSHIEGYTECGDCESAIRVAQTLGAAVEKGFGRLTIKGIGKTAPGVESVNVGESGLLARLMIPVISAVNGGSCVVTGDGTLLGRPLPGAVNIMAAFGVMLRNEYDKESHETHVPAVVTGQLIPGTADVSGAEGSQLISGLMMALPLCGKQSSVYVGEPKGIPEMYLTQDVMRSFGVKIATEMEGDAEMLEQQDWSYCTGMNFRIPGGQTYKAADFKLEADWGAAAVALTAGAIFGSTELTGLDTGSLQSEISILDILVQAGAAVSEMQDEDGRTVICVKKSPLEAFETNLDNAPGLFPVTAVLAAFCAGVSRIEGLERLRTNETDRADSLLGCFQMLGVDAQIEGNTLVIAGETLAARCLRGHLLHGGKFNSGHDHRLVMALSIAEFGASSPIVIEDESCIEKFWPGFKIR